jgi:hypothetical protein
LCAVDVPNRKFKLGRLTLRFDNEVPLKDIKEFLEEFLILKVDTPIEDEYFEHVKIDYITEKAKVGNEVVENFVGAVFYTDFGTVLKVGVELPTISWEQPHYVFRYYPQNLSISSNNFNLTELANAV